MCKQAKCKQQAASISNQQRSLFPPSAISFLVTSIYTKVATTSHCDNRDQSFSPSRHAFTHRQSTEPRQSWWSNSNMPPAVSSLHAIIDNNCPTTACHLLSALCCPILVEPLSSYDAALLLSKASSSFRESWSRFSITTAAKREWEAHLFILSYFRTTTYNPLLEYYKYWST